MEEKEETRGEVGEAPRSSGGGGGGGDGVAVVADAMSGVGGASGVVPVGDRRRGMGGGRLRDVVFGGDTPEFREAEAEARAREGTGAAMGEVSDRG